MHFEILTVYLNVSVNMKIFLGLVNLGSTMQTNHQANGSHCNNSSCLMHYASETSDIPGFLITGSIPALDANCRADLAANGGQ